MQFKNIVIQSLAAIEAPVKISTAQISERLRPTMERLGIRASLLEQISGISARRFWNNGTQPSEAATMAAEKAINEAGIDRHKIGVLINTSVCRDYLEPSTACLVQGNLGLSEECINFDVGNACLAFLNGMDIAARMLEREDVDYALVVDGESSGPITESTIERLLQPGVDEQQFRSEFASLTLGSGAAAMVMTRLDLAPDGHRYLGSVTRSATEFNTLCCGQMDRMVTDTRVLMAEGLKLATKTFEAAREALGWMVDELDQFIIHQIGKAHIDSLMRRLRLDPQKIFRIYPEFGNVGPAAVPIALAQAVENGKINRGDRVALLGIGSGLNCSMAEIVW